MPDQPQSGSPANAAGEAPPDIERLRRAHAALDGLAARVGQVIVGQRATVRPLLAATLAQGHCLIIGVPGLAKTLLVRTLAAALGWRFRRIQFTPDMMPADIIGMELLHEHADRQRAMRFVPGPIFANLVLADEINRTPPKTQSALLEAMQEYSVTSLGTTHRIDRPFVVFATQNPIEQEGTYPLPEAQLDRFMLSLWVDYPSAEEERQVVQRTTGESEASVDPIDAADDIADALRLVRRVPVAEAVVDYAVALARATRPTATGADDFVREHVEWGAGPRASQQLVLLGKALAVIDGRPAVSVADVREAAPLVLRHRVLPSYFAQGEGIGAVQVIEHVMRTTPEPGEQ